MQIVRVKVRNFRGIADGEVHLDGHTVLVGDNNSGKSTLLEAIDLVLGPERLSKRPVVDEHDFCAGMYVDTERKEVVPIQVEVVVAELSDDQQRHFRDHLEWWDSKDKKLLVGPPTIGTDQAHVWVRSGPHCVFIVGSERGRIRLNRGLDEAPMRLASGPHLWVGCTAQRRLRGGDAVDSVKTWRSGRRQAGIGSSPRLRSVLSVFDAPGILVE